MEVMDSGAVNAHTHLYSGLASLGMPQPSAPPQNFVQILERVWWRLDRALDRASLRASARLYIAESLLLGTTTLIDHHESPNFIEGSLDVLAEAALELGIRLITCYGATCRNGGDEEGRRGLDECARFIRRYEDHPHIRGMVGLHASFTVSDDVVRRAGDLCRDTGAKLHVHMAEDGADVEDAKRRGYQGPLQRLFALNALPEGSILAHGVHLTEDEVKSAYDRGLWFVQNPRSNANNNVGYARSLSASPRVALGTDGFPADMAEECAALVNESYRAGHLQAFPRAFMRERSSRHLAREVFGEQVHHDRSAWRQGALRPSRVVVGDQTVVEGGKLTRADIDEIRADAAAQAKELWARMRAIPE